MNDAIVCEKCNYDLFMICPDGLTVCNHCGEFLTVPNVSPTIDDETKRMVLELCDYVDGEKALPHCPSILTEQIRERLEAGE